MIATIIVSGQQRGKLRKVQKKQELVCLSSLSLVLLFRIFSIAMCAGTYGINMYWDGCHGNVVYFGNLVDENAQDMKVVLVIVRKTAFVFVSCGFLRIISLPIFVSGLV
jgi:hypothetical protein